MRKHSGSLWAKYLFYDFALIMSGGVGAIEQISNQQHIVSYAIWKLNKTRLTIEESLRTAADAQFLRPLRIRLAAKN